MAAPCNASSIRGEVADVVDVGGGGVRLDVAAPEGLTAVRPSQFFMVRRGDGSGPFLARPFSLYWRERRGGRDVLSFLLKVVGPGTRALADLTAGAPVELVGPLGNGFPRVKPGSRLVCAAGGVGIATFPLVFAEAIADGVKPGEMVLCFGAAAKAQLYEVERYRAMGIRVEVATMDGSAGVKGTVMDLLTKECEGRKGNVQVFTCGPERMLEAVARYCVEKGIGCWLSLETRMGCGTGVCNVCAVPVKTATNDGWPVAKACREGPVFAASSLVMEEAHEF
jgi:dihydroorotate dehydrogenase electron transfer subunit